MTGEERGRHCSHHNRPGSREQGWNLEPSYHRWRPVPNCTSHRSVRLPYKIHSLSKPYHQLRCIICLWHFRGKLQHIVSNWQIETQTLEELPFMVFTLRGATITFCGWESESHRSCDLRGGPSAVVTNKGIPTKTPWSPHRPFPQIYCQGSEDSWEVRE